MFFFINNFQDKPNRFKIKNKDSNSTETREYHLDYARFCVAQSSDAIHSEFIAKTKVNKQFYKGDQWTYQEDIEAFLMDDSKNTRNRIKIIHNLIRPMVEQYRGNAIRLKINASAQSISSKAVNRRETALAEQLLKTRVAEEFPNLGNIIRDQDKGIGESEEETKQIFENLYVDGYVDSVNGMMKFVKELNNFEEKQVRISQNLALSGVAVLEGFEKGGHQRYEIVESEEFFFDRSAQKYDLSDADYMGKCVGMLPTDIYESYTLTQDERESIEGYVSDTGKNINTFTTHEVNVGGTKIPVCHSYWRDEEKKEYGYVLDDFGYPYLTEINKKEVFEGEKDYKDEDLISPPDNLKNKKLFKGEKKRNMFVDVLRFCIFIPGEAISAKDANGTVTKRDLPDIILDHGLVPYQETEYLDPTNVKFPFKVFCWGYVDGEIMSPVDDAINPQRFINRIMSVAESQINNSGGSNVVIDKGSIDEQGGEDELRRSINSGKPITIRTKGLGIPNSVGTYDATPKKGTYDLFNILPVMQNMIQQTTGVNEGLKGESTGPDQLVGVTELLIQRGSLMQEPFYNAMGQIFLQAFQHIATVGKRLYIDNERELAIITGDSGVEVFRLSKGIRSEDFRVFIKRENSEETLINNANNLLNVLFQSQLIDKNVYANLFGRSTPDEVLSALRGHTKKQAELERQQAKAAQEQEAVLQQQLQQQQGVEQQLIDQQKQEIRLDKQDDQQHDLDKITTKGIVDQAIQSEKNAVQ